jgi:hypothetical protein
MANSGAWLELRPKWVTSDADFCIVHIFKNPGMVGDEYYEHALSDIDDSAVDSLVGRGIKQMERDAEVDERKAEEALRKKMEEETAAKAKEEEDRKAKLSDLEKWDEWVSGIEKSAPAMSSAIGKHAVENLVDQVKRMRESIAKDL